MNVIYKVALLSAFGLCLGMTACDEGDYTDWADVQSNDAESPITLSFTATSASAINFADLTDDDEYVTVFTPTITTNIDSVETTYEVVLNESVTLSATEGGQILASDLQSAITTLYGLAGTERNVPSVVIAYNNVDGVTFKRTAEITITATLVAPDFVEFIYVPGNGNGWSTSTCPALRSADFDGVYTGFAYLDGGFKFTLARNWDNEYNYTNFPTCDFNNVDGTNINAENAAFYYIKADVASGTLTGTAVSSIALIGSINGSSWDTDYEMTLNDEKTIWTYTGAMTAGEFKFRINNAWDINLGGTADELDFDAANLKIETDGNYTISLCITRSDSDNMYYTIQAN